MGWLSDLFSGNSTAAGRSRTATEAGADLERVRQLRQGVESAAAAVADRHGRLARESVEAADALVEGVDRADDREGRGDGQEGRGGGRYSDASRVLSRLHFALLRVSVQGADPEEAGVSDEVEAVRGLAGTLGGDAGEDPEAGTLGTDSRKEPEADGGDIGDEEE